MNAAPPHAAGGGGGGCYYTSFLSLSSVSPPLFMDSPFLDKIMFPDLQQEEEEQ